MLCSKLVCRCRGRPNVEQKFPHHNWITVLSIQFLISSSFSIVAPSIYKFITTSPQSPPDELESEKGQRFWPGLGGSDADYAWALMSAPLLELITMPFTAAMVHKLPFTVSILFGLFLYAIGGALYALADNVWMVFIGYGLFGAGSTSAAALHAYIGEMGSVMDTIRERQGKKKMKFAIYLAFSFLQNGGYLLSFVLTSILAQFPDINPYHWPGWFVTAEAMFIATAVALCFTETRSCKHIKSSHFKFSSSLAELRLFTKTRTKPCIRLICYIFLFACGYMNGQLYAFLGTMVTPVLSDKFGLTVEYTSHFLIGIAVAYLVGSVFLLVTKLVNMNNRPILGISLLVVLVGSIIAADWKSVGHDPCSDYFLSNASASIHGSGIESTYQHLIEWCEAQNSSDYQCFWNQESRITGEFCNTCLDACLSVEKSHNIYHFTVGVLLIAVSASVGFVTISAIASDITSMEFQGVTLTLFVASGTISRTLSPLWFMESYLWTERHTLFALGANALFALVLLLSLAVLYRNLAPKPKKRDENMAEISAVNASSKIAEEEESNVSDSVLPASHYFETIP